MAPDPEAQGLLLTVDCEMWAESLPQPAQDVGVAVPMKPVAAHPHIHTPLFSLNADSCCMEIRYCIVVYAFCIRCRHYVVFAVSA